MLISVIIPVYNAEKYLEYCVESVILQTFSDYEILLIDDGSTDNSSKLCDSLSEQHEKIRVIHKENGGASSARNVGITEAKGRYIHFIDSDDFLPNENIYAVLGTSLLSNADIVFSRRIRYNEDLTECTAIQPEYLHMGLFEGDVLYNVIKNDYELTLTCPVNKLFRTEFLQNNKLFFKDGLLHEEDEWLPRVIVNTKRVYFDNHIIYGVRQCASGSFSSTNDDNSLYKRTKSKLFTVKTGIDYMGKTITDNDTLKSVTGYYWSYMINAIVGIGSIKDNNLKRASLEEVKKNKGFFYNYKKLENKNWRIMGWMFTHLGTRFTSKIVALRYKYF